MHLGKDDPARKDMSITELIIELDELLKEAKETTTKAQKVCDELEAQISEIISRSGRTHNPKEV